MLGSVEKHEVIGGVKVGDGTNVTIALLTMRTSGDTLVNVRIKAADGRSLSVRLGATNARHFAVALARAIGELDVPEAFEERDRSREKPKSNPEPGR